MAKPENAIPACPKCEKRYGTTTRKDGTIRCKLCGYEGPTGKEGAERETALGKGSA